VLVDGALSCVEGERRVFGWWGGGRGGAVRNKVGALEELLWMLLLSVRVLLDLPIDPIKRETRWLDETPLSPSSPIFPPLLYLSYSLYCPVLSCSSTTSTLSTPSS
jgi:hypothetical protein